MPSGVSPRAMNASAERTLSAAGDMKWLARERQSGSFLRQLNLGEGIDRDRITASYDNGVLSVTIPVSEKAKPRKIEIAAGAREPQSVSAHSTK